MANGFITLENGEDFFTRWTGYDMIIRIIINELSIIEGGEELAKWLKTRIPNENEAKGDAVFFNQKDEMIQRIIDLRGLTKESRFLFWKALEIGKQKLKAEGKKYSPLNPERIKELLLKHNEISSEFDIEKELENVLIINGENIEKIGPGW